VVKEVMKCRIVRVKVEWSIRLGDMAYFRIQSSGPLQEPENKQGDRWSREIPRKMKEGSKSGGSSYRNTESLGRSFVLGIEIGSKTTWLQEGGEF